MGNVIITDNEQFGLVVWETSASARVKDSVFRNNVRGAVRVHNGGTLTLTDNTFEGDLTRPTFYIAGDATVVGSGNLDQTSGGVSCRFGGEAATVTGTITFEDSDFVIGSDCSIF